MQPLEGRLYFRQHSASLIGNAQRLRTNTTLAERRLWGKLSREQTGHRFRRQHPINHYIVDFVCLKQNLVIELDGGQHNDEEHQSYDEERTALLNQLGYHVLRFWNHEVLENLDGVYAVIIDTLNHADPLAEDPHPSSP